VEHADPSRTCREMGHEQPNVLFRSYVQMVRKTTRLLFGRYGAGVPSETVSAYQRCYGVPFGWFGLSRR
jgi:hypothetical protein